MTTLPKLPNRPNWQPRWVPNKYSINPLHYSHWDHVSGYSVGEVDAGRYMAANVQGEVLIDETGDYCCWASPEEAMKYVEMVLENEAAKTR